MAKIGSKGLLTSRRLILTVALAWIAAGCAARVSRPTPTVPASVGPGDVSALIRQGCYRCLEQAYDDAQAHGNRPQAFEAASLLVLRSKELGLPAESWLERARTLAPADSSSSMYLDIVDTIPPDRLSANRDALFDVSRRRRARDRLVTWRDALHSGPTSDVFRAYLDVSLVCAFGTLKETDASFSAAVDPVTVTPLLQYAVGICDATHAPRLAALRAGDAGFVDADFALGRYALEDPITPDPDEGLRRLESAAAAFPRSPAIATRIGNLYRLWEDWTPALAAFDAALAVAPDHPEATIGRVISLSHLERSDEAIETATRLIDGGQWLLAEAYYWRAWNRLRLDRYALARTDADRALTLMANAAVHVLSGVIEWRMGRLETAEQEFQGALTIDLGECEAAFDLGVVRDQRGRLPEAIAAFKQAGQCYDLSIALRREAIAKVAAGPGSDALKARETARHERVLADLEERRQEVTRVMEAMEKVSRSN
jgi:tetratricopeptide (TPR) repeat protein